MSVYIEASKDSLPIAVGRILSDGTFEQILPTFETFKNKERWEENVVVFNGQGIIYSERNSLDYGAPDKKPSWVCKYCNKDSSIYTHRDCIKKAGTLQTFLIERIWSDPKLQKLFRYQN